MDRISIWRSARAPIVCCLSLILLGCGSDRQSVESTAEAVAVESQASETETQNQESVSNTTNSSTDENQTNGETTSELRNEAIRLEDVSAAREAENQRLSERLAELEARIGDLNQVLTTSSSNTAASNSADSSSESSQSEVDHSALIDPRLADSLSVTSQADEFLENLTEADLAYSVPSDMRAQVTETVELVLGLDATPEAVAAELSDSSNAVTERVGVSPVVEARLSGQNFTITAITEQKQPISTARSTRWAWEVTPQSEGIHKLHLSLSSTVLVGDSSTPITLRTFDREIEVRIDAIDKVTGFLAQNWQWLWSAVLIPVVGYFWTRRRKAKTDGQAQE